MPSAVIPSALGYPAVRLAPQPVHQRRVRPGPLVLGTAPRKSPTPAADRDRTVSRRSKPSSRAALMGEQPNPWDLLQPRDATHGDPLFLAAQTIPSSNLFDWSSASYGVHRFGPKPRKRHLGQKSSVVTGSKSQKRLSTSHGIALRIASLTSPLKRLGMTNIREGFPVISRDVCSQLPDYRPYI